MFAKYLQKGGAIPLLILNYFVAHPRLCKNSQKDIVYPKHK